MKFVKIGGHPSHGSRLRKYICHFSRAREILKTRDSEDLFLKDSIRYSISCAVSQRIGAFFQAGKYTISGKLKIEINSK